MKSLPQSLHRCSTISVWVLALVLLTPTVAPGAVGSADDPQIVLTETKRAFGQVFAGEVLKHTFLVRNVGTAPLEMSDRPLSLIGAVFARAGAAAPT